ncbi:BA14K-like protein [Hoeflea sp. IMCC20628]|uniref:BA14K family protein n=1 Tax=Hoeflea sp. IMCC20628 TaxID=1620421 RepID=UPI00063AE82F|nr:BA14K family protein [Hoeflea sp. IMCC20628]AKI01732.1 BA14K-like protein [Hoeflea sp. IMCC20628]
MLKTTVRALISVSFCLTMIMPASAVPLQKPAAQIEAPSSLVVPVESGKHGKMYRNNRNRGFYRQNNRGYYNGHRGYRHQRRGYRQHNGYWFPPAAFALGAIIGGALNNNGNNGYVRPGYSNPQHVGWCYNKYRSYRERDNSFQPYQGGRRECRSPYY